MSSDSENPNTNCLDGMRCTNPECDQPFGPFEIHSESWFKVFDDGTDSYSDVEWDESSETICCNCHTSATVGELRGEEPEEPKEKYFVLSSSDEGVVYITVYTKKGLEKALNQKGAASWPEQERIIKELVFNNVTEWDRKKNYMIIKGELVVPDQQTERSLP